MELSEWDYDQALSTFRAEVEAAGNAESRTELRNRYLSKKHGLVGKLLTALRAAPPEAKRAQGRVVNLFKKEVEAEFKKKDAPGAKAAVPKLDLTLPGVRPVYGNLHPLTRTMHEMCDFFVKMGYDISDGPEIETDWYNFQALNTPEDHPAREEADTFYLEQGGLLRTQTSGCQIRYMEQFTPPFRMVAPGKVFRRDDDPTHSPMFHQLEGLVVGEDVSFTHLKGTLEAFAKHIFGDDVVIRLRPSYFPFTEPSAEVDVSCPFCEDGCRLCGHTKWIEILGCGMVDPNVLDMSGVDSERYTGFAFGMGIERVAMLKYRVPDIRYFYQNDRRFLDRFKVG